MKKLISFIFAVAFSASLFAVDFSAQVVSVSGKAQVLYGSEWKNLSVGDFVRGGDTIQTGFKSSLSIKIKDSVVDVSPLTRMTVEELSDNQEKDNVRVFVTSGAVSSNVNKTNGKKVGFTVRTPVATASVRGTEFSVENGFSSTNVETSRGVVAVWNGANKVSVSKNSSESSSREEFSASDENVNVSFENAPHGSFTVGRNQGAHFMHDGSVVSPQNDARGNMLDIGGGMSSPNGRGGFQGNVPTPKTKPENSASLIVNVTVFE